MVLQYKHDIWLICSCWSGGQVTLVSSWHIYIGPAWTNIRYQKKFCSSYWHKHSSICDIYCTNQSKTVLYHICWTNKTMMLMRSSLWKYLRAWWWWCRLCWLVCGQCLVVEGGVQCSVVTRPVLPVLISMQCWCQLTQSYNTHHSHSDEIWMLMSGDNSDEWSVSPVVMVTMLSCVNVRCDSNDIQWFIRSELLRCCDTVEDSGEDTPGWSDSVRSSRVLRRHQQQWDNYYCTDSTQTKHWISFTRLESILW